MDTGDGDTPADDPAAIVVGQPCNTPYAADKAADGTIVICQDGEWTAVGGGDVSGDVPGLRHVAREPRPRDHG